MSQDNRPLHVFLCHSSGDKPMVRELYHKLSSEKWIDPWLDEVKLLPGHDWHLEIEQAVEVTDAVIACLSNNSVAKEGYVQRELKNVLDIADEKPEGTIFIIPLRLEECPLPRRLRNWQYVDYFPDESKNAAYERVISSLKLRAKALGIFMEKPKTKPMRARVKAHKVKRIRSKPADKTPELPIAEVHPTPLPEKTRKELVSQTISELEFVHIPSGPFLMGSDTDFTVKVKWFEYTSKEKAQHEVDIPYDYWIGRFPITNEQYAPFVDAVRNKLPRLKAFFQKHPVMDWKHLSNHPAVSVSWKDAQDYLQWLNDLKKTSLPQGFSFRLPTEAEWEKAARGTKGFVWPWGNEFDKTKCNTAERLGSFDYGATTPVDFFSPQGDSPFGCADMAGNVWEWTQSLMKDYPYDSEDGRENLKAKDPRVLRGGCYVLDRMWARTACRMDSLPSPKSFPPYDYIDPVVYTGFRIVLSDHGF